MIEREIISYIINHINELIDVPGIRAVKYLPGEIPQEPVTRPDIIIVLPYDDREIKLVGEVVSQVRPIKLDKIFNVFRGFRLPHGNYLPVLISSFISREIRKRCRHEGIGYIDCSGNVYIFGPGLLISKETDRNRFPEKIKGAGYFRDKASIVLKKMLSDKNCRWKIRDLNKETGVSLGYVSEVINSLKESAFVTRSNEGSVKLVRISELLSDWLGFYKFNRQNKIYPYYINESEPEDIMEYIQNVSDNLPSQKYCFTLHAAASFISPWTKYSAVHMYVDGPYQIWEKKLGLIKAERDANIFLVQPYYKTSVFADAQNVGRFFSIVSDIQLFLDLYNFPIRGRETAEHLFEKRLKDKLGLSEIP